MTTTLLLTLLTLGDPATLTGGYLFHRRLAEMAPAHGARITFVSVPDRPFPLAVVDGPAVLRQAWASRADALVLDSIAAAFVGPWLAAREPPTPLVGMLHQPPGGIDHGPVRTAVQSLLDWLAYRRAWRLLVASEALATQLRAQGLAPDRLRVVPPGRDVAAAAGPDPGDLRLGRRAAFLCVANWLPRKGILELLEAFAKLPADAATLHCVGDTDADPAYSTRVRRRLARPDLAGCVVVHGRQTREQVAPLYAAADAFVLASVREPYGTVYGEAMASGLPVVGWAAGNLPHLARDGVEGLVVPTGDLPALAAALARMADNQALRERMGAAARERALSRPTWDQTAGLFFGAIREVVRSRRS